MGTCLWMLHLLRILYTVPSTQFRKEMDIRGKIVTRKGCLHARRVGQSLCFTLIDSGGGASDMKILELIKKLSKL
jgi:hypothetical protein